MVSFCLFFFFLNDTPTTEIYTLSLHDALPISLLSIHYNNVELIIINDGSKDDTIDKLIAAYDLYKIDYFVNERRSEEHTSELQSRRDLVCRLLLEKKKKKTYLSRTRTIQKDHA